MSEWRHVTNDIPKIGETVLVAYHGHGRIILDTCRRIDNRGWWGDWDYINSHDGEPQLWSPIPDGLPPLESFINNKCGCDSCTEAFNDLENQE
jgi:hypothetical protein